MNRKLETARESGMRAMSRYGWLSMATATLLVLASSMFPAAARQTPQQTENTPGVIHSEAGLVLLPVLVTDHEGHFVTGLSKENFRVYDEGKPQAVSLFMDGEVPVTVGLLIDCSSSMQFNRDQVMETAREFLQASNAEDQIFVVNFNQAPGLGLPQSMAFTSDVMQLESAIQAGPRRGMTALYDAVSLGLEHLAAGKNSRKALIVISDGGDNASTQNLRHVLNAIQRSSAVVYTIGIVDEFQADVNPGVLRKFADASGGQAYFPRRTYDLPGLGTQIARDLREQYTIAFLPNASANGKSFRSIRVAIAGPQKNKLKVRTRTGYRTGAEPEAAATNR